MHGENKYKIGKKKPKKIQGYILSQHAKERSRKRNISYKEIENTIIFGKRIKKCKSICEYIYKNTIIIIDYSNSYIVTVEHPNKKENKL